MNKLTPEQLEWVVGFMAHWAKLLPVVQGLIVMIGLDLVSGILLAISKRTLNSTTSFGGMCKKASMLLFVGVGMVLEPFTNNIPFASMIALAFLWQEVLSIMENMAALGLYIPPAIVAVLSKAQDNRKSKLEQKTGGVQATRDNTAASKENTEALNRRVEQSESQRPVMVAIPNPIAVVLTESQRMIPPPKNS